MFACTNTDILHGGSSWYKLASCARSIDRERFEFCFDFPSKTVGFSHRNLHNTVFTNANQRTIHSNLEVSVLSHRINNTSSQLAPYGWSYVAKIEFSKRFLGLAGFLFLICLFFA